MSADDGPLLDVAIHVADGDDIDWELTGERTRSRAERETVEGLRAIASIAAVHRGLLEGDKEPPPPQDAVLPIGTWQHFELLEKIGEGSFAEVYRARDTRLDTEVALKLQKPRGAGPPPGTGPVREGRLLARVRHPNVVTVFGADSDGERVGIWMELVRGRTLDDVLRTHGPFGAEEAALVGIDLCRALAAVHAAGLIHQDVKLQNVMRAEGGRIVLMDLGAGLERWPQGTEDSIAGTAPYVAPEVLSGARPSPASDLYATGVLLFRLVTGRFPSRGQAPGLRDARPDLGAAFIDAIERALESDPTRRHASAGEFESALRATLSGSVSLAPSAEPRRPVRALVAASVVIVLVAAAGWVAWRAAAERAPASPPSVAAPQPPAATAAPAVERTPPHAVPAAPRFTVDAVLFRTTPDGVRQPLFPDATVRPGDLITLRVTPSRPVYLYVINTDDLGHAYLLFPLPGLARSNPLPAGGTIELPGPRTEQPQGSIAWQVSSAGGRERFLLVATAERWTEFENDAAKLDRPAATDAVAVALPPQANVTLRGLGGLSGIPDDPLPAQRTDRLAALAARLAGSPEALGTVWVRQLELRNPRD